MFFHKVSAVAITDENGRLVSTFSASELRGVGQHNFEWLLLPISDFLRRIASITEVSPSSSSSPSRAYARLISSRVRACVRRASRRSR
jgi:hypothetical protein